MVNTPAQFVPYDRTVFAPGTWGALGWCNYCVERRPAEWMKHQARGKHRTPTWVAFCGHCRTALDRKILSKLRWEDRRRPAGSRHNL